jgi:hypothetical protein
MLHDPNFKQTEKDALENKKNEIYEKIKVLRRNNQFRYYIEFDRSLEIVGSDIETRIIVPYIHYSDINVKYDSRKDGLNPIDNDCKKLVSEIFAKYKEFDLSKTTYFVIHRI